ncbi:MAG: EAL domain-containing protein [Clostridia bacterium]
MKKHIKKYIKKISLITLAVSSLLCLTVFSSDAQVIKVGYVQNYGVIKTPGSNGHNGYGYEYLEKISEYTTGNYIFEYIECELTEYETLLANGTIDIFAPAQMPETTYSTNEDGTTQASTGNFIYSALPFTSNTIFLTDLKVIAEDICMEYEYLNNKTIGVTSNSDSIVSKVNSFLAKYGVSAQIIETRIGQYSDEYQQQNYDFIITSSLQMEHNLNTIAKIDEFPVYFVAHSSNSSLMSDINSAMQKINDNEYNFVSGLVQKYFDYTLVYKEHIDNSEYNDLIVSAPFKVGVTDTHTPFGYENLDGDPAGISIDIIEELFKKFDVSIEYELLPKDLSGVNLSDYDFLLLSAAQTANVELRETKPYAHIPFIMVEDKSVSVSNSNVGLLESYAADNSVVNYFLPLQNITRYESPEALITAFNKGEISTLFVTDSTFSMILPEIEATNHTLIEVDYFYAPTITISDKFTDEQYATINKMLSYLSEETVQYSLLKHSTLISEEKLSSLNVIIIVVVCLLIIGIAYAVYKYADKKRRHAILAKSRVDSLTGLLTEQEFIRMTRKILNDNPTGTYSIISIDIDNFRLINEASSYQVGSKVIRIIADFLQEVIEDDMPCARCFADNFILLANTYGLTQKIEKFLSREDLLEQINPHLNTDTPISFSIGRYTIEDVSADVNHMIDCANSARTLGKKTLGTTMNKYSQEIKRKTEIHNDVVTSMNKAIENKEFVLYYQLKVDLKELQLSGAEALVRWISEDKVIPPSDFIPIFEENGFIEKLDFYVLETACIFIQQNRSRAFPKISINVSGITMMNKNMVSQFLAITQKYGVNPNEIDIEITESAFVDHADFSQSKIRKLRSLGFTISMDDFGTGISTLNRLKDISFDTLKIDRAFIIDSLDNQRSSKIIKNIIQMAKDLDLDTVAEGIETPEQLIFLRDMGCEYGQGFYFSRPLPGDEFLEILKRY